MLSDPNFCLEPAVLNKENSNESILAYMAEKYPDIDLPDFDAVCQEQLYGRLTDKEKPGITSDEKHFSSFENLFSYRQTGEVKPSFQ